MANIGGRKRHYGGRSGLKDKIQLQWWMDEHKMKEDARVAMQGGQCGPDIMVPAGREADGGEGGTTLLGMGGIE